ncbi:MAG: hypothetical protein KKI13_03425 [Candidatus Omnitrophica bacterium]|nr:hypothetical protein [Candidatus Omnitrophota bacterium]MCG2705614.1 hypothetical protein [Candidatus Omnitrophota bacterium]
MSVIVTAIISFSTPKVYEVSMVVELPTIGVDDSGTPIFVVRPDIIKAKIEDGVFNLNVVNVLKLDSQKAGIGLKVSQPRDLTLLKLNIDEPEDKKELGTKILNQFFNEMADFYKDSTETRKGDIDNRITLISNQIKKKNDSIKLNEENFKIFEIRAKEVISEIMSIKINTEQLLAKRDILLEKKVQADDPGTLLYLDVIQQNISCFDRLNNQLADIKIRKNDTANGIKSRQNEITEFGIEIERLKRNKENIHGIKLIQKPRASLKATGPNKKKNIVLAGILGLMAGTLSAFFTEFLEKTRPT